MRSLPLILPRRPLCVCVSVCASLLACVCPGTCGRVWGAGASSGSWVWTLVPPPPNSS